jgi:hypothetical protein
LRVSGMPQLQFDTLPALASIVSSFANAALLGKVR